MNENLFEAKMKEFRDNYESLSEALSLSSSGLANKKKGRSQFTLRELSILRSRWELTPDEFDRIFFDFKVS